jgi:hypothetical protein
MARGSTTRVCGNGGWVYNNPNPPTLLFLKRGSDQDWHIGLHFSRSVITMGWRWDSETSRVFLKDTYAGQIQLLYVWHGASGNWIRSARMETQVRRGSCWMTVVDGWQYPRIVYDKETLQLKKSPMARISVTPLVWNCVEIWLMDWTSGCIHKKASTPTSLGGWNAKVHKVSGPEAGISSWTVTDSGEWHDTETSLWTVT